MNTKKILLSVLICLVMVAALCLGVACNQETKLDLSDATQWGPAVAEGEDDIYRVSNSDGLLVMDFAKNDTYNATKITFDNFEVSDIEKVKTLVVTAKMTTDAPYPALLFKVEGTDDPAAAEVKVKATEDYTTYEWDFAGYDLTKVVRFLIFADPGVAGSSGKITIKEIYLTSNELNAANDATTKPAEEGKAPAPVWNEVTATNMAIGNWVDGTPNNVYTATKNADNSYTIDVHKKIGAGNWDALISYIYGDALATAKSFKIVVKGTAGKQILVKPFDNFEKRVTLTGENQEIIIDVHTVAEDAASDFSKKDAPTATNKVCIMGLPDVNTGNDTLKIISAEFSTEAAAPVVDTTIVNEITTENHKITKGWEPLDAGTYTVTADGTALKVAYTTKGAYQFLRTFVKGAEIANMKSIVFTVKGVAGDKVLLKPFDQPAPMETTVTLTGGNDVVKIDISSYVNGKTFADKEPVLICAAPGVEGGKTGEFTLVSVEFTTDVVIDESVNVITTTNHKVTKGWKGLDEGVYTVTADGTALKVAYTTKGAYQFLRTFVKGAEIANMKTIVFTVKGVAGDKVLLKPFNQAAPMETTVTLTGGNDVVKIDISSYVTGKTFDAEEPILICAAPGVEGGKTGEFTLISVEFSTDEVPVEPEPENPNLNTITNANKAIVKWYAEEANVEKFDLTPNQNGTTTVVKTGTGWQQLKADVTGADIVNFTLLRVKLTGVNNLPFVVRCWDGVEYFYDGREVGGVVQAIPATNEVVVEVKVPAGDYTTTKSLIVFLNVNGNNAEATCTVTVSAEFGNPVNVITAENTNVTKWYGDSSYTFNYKADGSVEVTKAKGASWTWFRADVSGADLADMKTFKIVLKGMNGKDIIVKPYDKVEAKREPATEDEITLIIDLTTVTGVDYNGTLSIIVTFDFNGKVTEDTKFTIVSAEFSTEEAPAA